MCFLSSVHKMSIAIVALSYVFRIPVCKSFISSVRPAGPRIKTAGTSFTGYQSSGMRSVASSTNSKISKSESNSVEWNDNLEESKRQSSTPILNLFTVDEAELERLLTMAGHPSYRAKQVLHWVRKQGAVSVEQMVNLPTNLRRDLKEWTSAASSPNAIGGTLTEVTSQKSKDGTIKCLYALENNRGINNNGNSKVSMIESVLMPYEDGRYTACISSQAGCAMGCKFCATGQMGFTRQLTAEEIYEQVARFDAQVRSMDASSTGVSNVVFMGMGEPLANYNNVMKAVRKIRDRLQISARRITISTVGVVPAIHKLIAEKDDLQVKLAVSLHCASDEERSKLIPANERYGGLTELLTSIQEYTEKTKRRITFEWALIDGQNDSPEVARTLGRLLTHGETQIRRDLIHINVIPLNPTGGYRGTPTARARVDAFLKVLTDEFHISATPRVRRGIDIDAGCGQLKAKQETKIHLMDTIDSTTTTTTRSIPKKKTTENDEPQYSTGKKIQSRVYDTTTISRKSPNIPINVATVAKKDDMNLSDQKRRRKLIKQLKMIEKLKDMKSSGALTSLNAEQSAKILRETIWKEELKTVEERLAVKPSSLMK